MKASNPLLTATLFVIQLDGDLVFLTACLANEHTNTFKRAFKKKPPRLQAAILECVKWLGEDVTHPGLRVHKMQGVGDIWEAYVDQANRVTYEWEGDTIVIRMNCTTRCSPVTREIAQSYLWPHRTKPPDGSGSLSGRAGDPTDHL